MTRSIAQYFDVFRAGRKERRVIGVTCDARRDAHQSSGFVVTLTSRHDHTSVTPTPCGRVTNQRRADTPVRQVWNTVTPGTQDNQRWDTNNWLAYFEQRATIAEHCGSISRADAEALAYDCCISEWTRRYTPAVECDGRCAACGGSETLASPLNPLRN